MQYMLRERSLGKGVSRFGLVVAVHVVLGAALIAGLNHVPLFKVEPPPVTWMNPKLMPKPVDIFREPEKVNLSTVQTVLVPPPVVPVESVPVVDIFSPTPTPFTPVENRDAAPTATGDASSEPASTTSNLGIACPNAAQVQGNMRYPAQAVRDGIEGDVTARFTVTVAGEIKNIVIVGNANRIFNNVVTQAVQQFGCRGQGQDVVVEAPFTFRIR